MFFQDDDRTIKIVDLVVTETAEGEWSFVYQSTPNLADHIPNFRVEVRQHRAPTARAAVDRAVFLALYFNLGLTPSSVQCAYHRWCRIA